MKITRPLHHALQCRTGIFPLRRGLFQSGSHFAAFPISHLLLILALVASLAAAAEPTQSVQAGAPGGYSEYFIPGATDQIMAILDDNEGSTIGSLLTNTITVSVSAKVKVYYDHWENGYHTGSSFDNWDETYTANKGDVLTFRSTNIPYPRLLDLNACSESTFPSGGTGGATNHCYDGRDRIYVAGGAVSVAQVFWPTSMGTVYANAWEIYPIKPYETTYTIPVGENLYSASGSYYDFDNVYVLAQALEDNTTIQIDDPNSAGVELTTTLGRGETTQYYHAHTGTTISGGGKPAQVQFLFGDDQSIGSNTKSYTAVPQSL